MRISILTISWLIEINSAYGYFQSICNGDIYHKLLTLIRAQAFNTKKCMHQVLRQLFYILNETKSTNKYIFGHIYQGNLQGKILFVV